MAGLCKSWLNRVIEMARPKKAARIARKRFEIRLGDTERDRLVARFIAESANASEAIKALIADYMEGRVLDAGGVVDVVQQILENAPVAAAPAQPARAPGKTGELDPNDPYVQMLKNALG